MDELKRLSPARNSVASDHTDPSTAAPVFAADSQQIRPADMKPNTIDKGHRRRAQQPMPWPSTDFLPLPGTSRETQQIVQR
jgi:hypothetical protein